MVLGASPGLIPNAHFVHGEPPIQGQKREGGCLEVEIRFAMCTRKRPSSDFRRGLLFSDLLENPPSEPLQEKQLPCRRPTSDAKLLEMVRMRPSDPPTLRRPPRRAL
jgi:hypothetical protein